MKVCRKTEGCIMMQFLFILYIVLAGVGFYYAQNRKKIHDRLRDFAFGIVDADDEMKRTLAMGLYMRFKKEESDGEKKNWTSHFIKQNEYDFEYFVADVMKNNFGGSVYVTPSSGDFGVDFELTTDEGLILGQVKCERTDVDYKPIAILHSQFVKQNAIKGIVATTSDFTEGAKTYAQEVGIELVNGKQLVEMWILGLENVTQPYKQVAGEQTA